jgi:hypothetical protein
MSGSPLCREAPAHRDNSSAQRWHGVSKTANARRERLIARRDHLVARRDRLNARRDRLNARRDRLNGRSRASRSLIDLA